MKFTLLHLFPEAMSLYGEYANLTLLSRLLTAQGAEVTVKTVGFDEAPDFAGADLIYMGAGTEGTQKAAMARLLPHKDALRATAENGALVLFTGNAMETLGASVTDQTGKVHEGLHLADFTTVETGKRTPHDVIAQPLLWAEPAVGFMNKCSTTKGIDTPLFSALPLGFGNEVKGGAEGYQAGNLLATHLTGPVLVKNPAFLRYVARRLWEIRGEPMPEERREPWMDHGERSYAVTYNELKGQIG